jgi:hypothetical protein
MIWRRSDNKVALAAVCALLLIAAGGAMAMRAAKRQGEPGGLLTRAVLTDKEAFLLGTPELIAGSEAGAVFPCPDGRYALVVRVRAQDDLPPRITAADPAQEPSSATAPEISVILWDSQTRKSSVVWKAGGSSLAGQFIAGRADRITWLPGTTNAVFLASTIRGNAAGAETDVRTSLVLLSAATGATRTLLTSTGDGSLIRALDVSPTRPVAVVQTYVLADIATGDESAKGTAALRVLRPNGSLGPAVRLPDPDDSLFAGFSPDGTQIYVATIGKYDRETRKRPPTTYAALRVNGTASALVPLDKKPQIVASQGDEEDGAPTPSGAGDALPVRLALAPSVLTRAQSRQNVRPVWLERADEPAASLPTPTNKPAPAKTTPTLRLAADSEPPRALVTADCDDAPLTNGANVNGALLLPDASAVLYRAGGALYAVPILRMDKATFLEARRRAQRMVVISNARQLGTGLMMYVQDYDEIYPSGDNINDKVGPYIKNTSLFQNFVYTFGVRSLADIDKPSELIIGYVTGPGGRANVFADGHVKWQDD